jgi:hypothetical protein
LSLSAWLIIALGQSYKGLFGRGKHTAAAWILCYGEAIQFHGAHWHRRSAALLI